MKKSNQAGRAFQVARALSAGFAIVILAMSPPASAAVVSASGTVGYIYTYPDFGGGDFVFRLSTVVAGCEGGFWISPSQPGFKTSVALILQARAMDLALTAGGNNAQLWSGSATAFCKLDYVHAS